MFFCIFVTPKLCHTTNITNSSYLLYIIIDRNLRDELVNCDGISAASKEVMYEAHNVRLQAPRAHLVTTTGVPGLSESDVVGKILPAVSCFEPDPDLKLHQG